MNNVNVFFSLRIFVLIINVWNINLSRWQQNKAFWKVNLQYIREAFVFKSNNEKIISFLIWKRDDKKWLTLRFLIVFKIFI